MNPTPLSEPWRVTPHCLFEVVPFRLPNLRCPVPMSTHTDPPPDREPASEPERPDHFLYDGPHQAVREVSDKITSYTTHSSYRSATHSVMSPAGVYYSESRQRLWVRRPYYQAITNYSEALARARCRPHLDRFAECTAEHPWTSMLSCKDYFSSVRACLDPQYAPESRPPVDTALVPALPHERGWLLAVSLPRSRWFTALTFFVFSSKPLPLPPKALPYMVGHAFTAPRLTTDVFEKHAQQYIDGYLELPLGFFTQQ